MEDVEDEPEEAAPYPNNAWWARPKFAAISTIVDYTNDMEVLVFIHAVYADEESAKSHVSDELNDALHPLPVDVVNMHEWIYPVRMLWNNCRLSTRVSGLDETGSNLELKEAQEERGDATKHNRQLEREAQKTKQMRGAEAAVRTHGYLCQSADGRDGRQVHGHRGHHQRLQNGGRRRALVVGVEGGVKLLVDSLIV